MAGEATGRDSDKFMLRLPDGMRDEIAAEAKKNNRSMNAEIVARLQSSFDREYSIEKTDIRRIIDEAAKTAVTEFVHTFEATSFRVVRHEGRLALEIDNDEEDNKLSSQK